MRRNDEEVLHSFRDNVQFVTKENGEVHLQFNLSWARDPATMKNNYYQVKNVLLKPRHKLDAHPELYFKYCEKLEAAIAKGHIVQVSEEELQNDGNSLRKPCY